MRKLKLSNIVPISIEFGDFHIGLPNAVYTTEQAVRNNSTVNGIFSQYIWDVPGYDNDIEHVCNNIRALGILASKYDQKFSTDSFMEDGMPSYFLDYASYVGYAMLEKYLVTDLCGARYGCGFGQLVSSQKMRAALILAFNNALTCRDDQPGLNYVYGGTQEQWDHDLVANWGVVVPELLIQAVMQKKYKIAFRNQLCPITEKVSIATEESITDIQAVAHRVDEHVDEWISMIDFSVIEKIADELQETGTAFFNNILEGFKEAGIDIEDPVQLLLALKRIRPASLEEIFHPSTYNKGTGLVPVHPTNVGQICMETMTEIMEELKANGYEGTLEGHTVVLAAADAHSYGAFVVESILKSLGAKVINGGVGVEAIDVLDLADESGTPFVCVSLHNGQTLDYAKQISTLAKERNRKYCICFGGWLVSILPGDTEASDVSEMVEELGIYACKTVRQTVDAIISGC